MKRCLCILLIGCLLLLAGCQSQPEESSSQKSQLPSSSQLQSSSAQESIPLPPWEDETLPHFPIPKEEQDPNKIIWYLGWGESFGDSQDQNFAPVENEITDKVNKRLNELGFTQKLEFRFIYVGTYDQDGKMVDNNQGDQKEIYRVGEYQDEIDRLLAEGAQVDLMNYQGQQAEFADLTPYFETEAGQTLRAGFDEKIWKALEDRGKNFYIPASSPTFGSQVSYIVNRKLMEKYGISEEELRKPFRELAPIFQKIQEKNGSKIPSLGWSNAVINDCPVRVDYKIMNNVLAISRAEHRGRAQNLYENEDFISYFKTMKEFYDKGFSNPGGSNEGSFLKVDTYGSFEAMKKENPTVGDTLTIPIGEAVVTDELRYLCTGVSASSQNKDKAFEALALVMTDPELSNLLMHGIEGKNYTLQDGVVIPKENYRENYTFGNNAITYPTEDQPKDKQTAFLEYEASLKTYDAISFKPDFSSVQKEMDAIIEILSLNYLSSTGFSLWVGKVENVDQTLEELNTKMKEAGLQKVLDEVNRQLDEYYAYLDSIS